MNTPGLPETGTVTGTVTVNAANASNAPQTIPVRLNVYASAGTSGPFGWMNTPIDGVTGVSGALAVTGWALDDVQVTRVANYRDPLAGEPAGPVFLGDASFVPDARPDLELSQPDAPRSYRAGWGLMVLTISRDALQSRTREPHAARRSDR